VPVRAPVYSAHFGWHPHMTAHTVTAPGTVAGPRAITGFAARLLECLPRLRAPHWRNFRFDAETPPTVVSYHGAIEIWETHVGSSVQTSVKGELGRARATALQRIASYLAVSNRIGTRLHAAGPLAQSEEAPGRWLVRLELPGVDDVVAAALPRNRKVRLRPAQPEVLAVLRMFGRPSAETIARAAAVIHAALAGTMWTPAGGPMIRLHRPPSMLSFADRFEVAVPIVRCRREAPSQRAVCGGARQQPPAKDCRTQESSSMCEPLLERGNALSQSRSLLLA
jgi:hypothetical protein